MDSTYQMTNEFQILELKIGERSDNAETPTSI